MNPLTTAPYFRSLCQRSLTTFWEIFRIMIPIMIALRLAETYGLIQWISPALRPVMAILNLPPEAAIVCLTSILAGLYGALATLPILIGHDLTAAQVTSLCAIMLIAHAIPVEQAIVRKAGGSFWGTTFLRLFAAGLAAFLIDVASKTTGFLSQPQPLDHLQEFARAEASHLDWALSNLMGMGLLFAILTGLLVMMDAFNRIGVTALINRLLAPIMRLSGLDRSVTSITTAGILLGLAYGGGLIIAHGNDPSISRKAKYYALCWLSLCHGLIEDVAIMVAIGGDFWVLFMGRIVLTFALVRTLMLWHQLFPKKQLAQS
ncbi:nucleoside recognition domain-containing protein [Sneathiella marina]|uniref:Nucleoside recognition domain-containing protein n=1 Tax=Sneathiella marina TaxID=2950108 RepID=A0ABY4VYT8_9PROT|nr:nucleoside recognition domain-containing protein [Sneathiella marina]USG60096.1 nucleoside recognition domain-containing protein [Sneathiella marina]